MKRIYLLILTFFLTLILPILAYSYGGITHGGITNQSELQSDIIDDYLIYIGYSEGRDTEFTLNFKVKDSENPGPCVVKDDKSVLQISTSYPRMMGFWLPNQQRELSTEISKHQNMLPWISLNY